MNFNRVYKTIGPVPMTLLAQADAGIDAFEKRDAYNFKHGEWLRLDSYHNPDNYQLADIVGQELIDHVMSYFPGEVLFGWSVSHLPPMQTIVDHADRMFFHRLAKRIIVPISNADDILNWHWNRDRQTKLPYTFPLGHVYRLNTSVTHGVQSFNKQARRAVYFDVMESRLYDKFKGHADIVTVILANAVGEKYVL